MRREPSICGDILEAVQAIKGFIVGQTMNNFVVNDLVRSAVLSKLMIIGEASQKISEQTQRKYASIPWEEIRGFRNYVIHPYHGINWEVVWNAANSNAPALGKEVERILSLEYPEYETEFE